MPIVSRVLTKLANREDLGAGVKRWRVDGVDSRGKRWTHGPFTAVEGAPAEAIRDAAWTTEQLEDDDEQEGMAFVEAGGAHEGFVREDLTITEWRRRLARRWWNTKIEGASDADLAFLCFTAAYIATFTAAQIATALGISEAKATKGINRAIDLRDNTCPAIFASDAEQEKVPDG
jgi:hypothetical protein